MRGPFRAPAAKGDPEMTGRTRARTWLRIGAAIFLALHAIAHSPGILGAWKIAELEDASFRPNVLLTDASDTLVAVLGAFWLIAAVTYLMATVGLFRSAPWWRTATFIAALVSLAMCLLWLEDAIAGLVVNIAILTALLLLNTWGLWRAFDTGEINPGAPSHA